MIGKVIVDAVIGTIEDLWTMAKSVVLMVAIVAIPMFVMVLILVGMALTFGNTHNIVLQILADLLPIVMMVFIFAGLYLYVKLPYAKTLSKAEKIAAQDVPVAGRLRVVLNRFHEDCYVNSTEFFNDLCMMDRLTNAHEEGKA